MKTAICKHLPREFPWADRILYFDTIDSTNTQAKGLAAQGAPQGTVVIAGSQSGGRGRMGRSFHSPQDTGIYLSVILRPGCPAAQLMHLTCATAVAMCDALEAASGLRPGIKWTNDLVWGRQKLGGILTELSLASDGSVDYAIVGIGINCAQQPGDFPDEIRSIAASLAMATGKTPDRTAVAAAMIAALKDMSDSLCRNVDAMMDRYRRNCITIGQAISVNQAGSVRYGTALDVDRQGALLVQFSDGHQETVHSGEVSIRGMYGYV